MSGKFKRALKTTGKIFIRDSIIYLIFSGIFFIHRSFEAWLRGFIIGMGVLLILTLIRFLYDIDRD